MAGTNDGNKSYTGNPSSPLGHTCIIDQVSTCNGIYLGYK